MARFTQFPLMITRLTIIYEIISPGAAGSSIYVQYGSYMRSGWSKPTRSGLRDLSCSG